MSETARSECVATADGYCSICGDEATLARVVVIDAASGTADVSHDGSTSRVAIDLVDDLAVGDAVLVHMGFAIARVEREGEV